MKFHVFLAVMRVPYERSCFLLHNFLMKFACEISCFLAVTRFPREISCFLVYMRFHEISL